MSLVCSRGRTLPEEPHLVASAQSGCYIRAEFQGTENLHSDYSQGAQVGPWPCMPGRTSITCPAYPVLLLMQASGQCWQACPLPTFTSVHRASPATSAAWRNPACPPSASCSGLGLAPSGQGLPDALLLPLSPTLPAHRRPCQPHVALCPFPLEQCA